jgi:DNA-binding CsgD family transcriptional regulator
MHSPASDPVLIAGLYDAAAEPSHWNTAWDAVRRAFGAETGILYREASGQSEPDVLVTNHWSPAATKLYRDHYVGLDPILARAMASPVSATLLSQEVVPPREAERSELYNDFALPYGGGAFHTLCAIIRLGGTDFLRIGLHRPIDGAAFDENDRLALEKLGQHVAAALRLRDQLHAEKRSSAAHAAALHQLRHGAVIVTATNQVLFANDAAESLAGGGGLILAGGSITCADRREAARLRSLIESAAQGGPGGTARISRGAHAPILAAIVTPLPITLANGTVANPEDNELALVTLKDLGATSDAGHANLIELFGLTGAEAAIVPQLLSGDSMNLIAQSRGVSVGTVRTQAARLLEKTGAPNLRALATMISALGAE